MLQPTVHWTVKLLTFARCSHVSSSTFTKAKIGQFVVRTRCKDVKQSLTSTLSLQQKQSSKPMVDCFCCCNW